MSGEAAELVWRKGSAQCAVCSGSFKSKRQQPESLALPTAHCPLPTGYLPKITQSPCDVPMKSSNGSDSQAFVREAIKACRANSGGAAGPVPAVAARIRLLLGQIMPQTLRSITIPYAPPTPIEYDLLLA